MSLILHIDTATEFASVCLTENDSILDFVSNNTEKNHGSFLHIAIKKLFSDLNIPISNLDAIAVTNGPGSYTGLRVGLASAKGLCYALNLKLITLDTLEVMAKASIDEYLMKKELNEDILFCPMIDARRMEVFTALYTQELVPVIKAKAKILDETSFADYLKSQTICFSGSGNPKFKELGSHKNAIFSNVQYSSKNMVELAQIKFNQQNFADLDYTKPNYGKDFFTTMKKIGAE